MTSTTTTAGSDTDRQAVLDVLAALYTTWEAGDAEAFATGYTDCPIGQFFLPPEAPQ